MEFLFLHSLSSISIATKKAITKICTSHSATVIYQINKTQNKQDVPEFSKEKTTPELLNNSKVCVTLYSNKNDITYFP